MNKINRKVEYALIALKHMRSKQPGEMTTVKELSGLYKCPFEATSKVLQTLAQHGMLRSEQGAHGGYQLVKDLHRISLYELMETIVGPVEIAKCLHERDSQNDSQKSLQKNRQRNSQRNLQNSSQNNSESNLQSDSRSNLQSSSQSPIQRSGCELRDSCNVVSPIHSLNKRLSEFYQALSVSELLDGRAPRDRQQEIREAAAEASHSSQMLRITDHGK